MNKQEAIEELEWNVVRTTDFDRAEDVIVFEKAKSIISQIHEPQKVVVPKFVAEWIVYAKTEGYSLYGAMEMAEEDSEIFNWLFNGNRSNQETFARAWLDGYTIEQERLYTLEIPNPVLTDNSDSVTVLMKIDSGVVLTDVVNYIGRKQEPVYHLTESEIKQDFEWAWDAGFAREVGDD
ncbi:DUF1642 domain-containing protein [Streptococcus suis]|uniref:DUF1642 domain-containing protein n=1 Tax=Streptococcus suis TaxID=1307 RepID=UPI000C17C372|nr:DUF1642 domain-containing protein [Streptococcus suis]